MFSDRMQHGLRADTHSGRIEVDAVAEQGELVAHVSPEGLIRLGCVVFAHAILS